MQAGNLRHRVTIQQVTETRDDMGGVTQTWSTFAANLHAEIAPLSGRELLLARQVNAETTHRIRLRYRAGITPKMRVLFGSRIFAIESVLDTEERGIEVVLLCREAL